MVSVRKKNHEPGKPAGACRGAFIEENLKKSLLNIPGGEKSHGFSEIL